MTKNLAPFPVELLKGHDNSPNGFAELAYIKLPVWLAKKLYCPYSWKKEDQEHSLFQVVEETEKAYKIIFCKDSSLSYNFVRITWYITYVSKSVVLEIRKDVETYKKEYEDYYNKKYNFKK